MPETEGRIRELGVVPVIVIEDPDAAGPLGEALADGGLPCAEVTFRTAEAVEAIRRMDRECPGLLLGAGTILTTDQAREALDAGAEFIVSPGLDAGVVEYCVGAGVAVFPGVCTPSEVQAAVGLGLRILKLFPAAALGGPQYLKAISAPFPGIEFVPTGGVSPTNLGEYLTLPSVAACGGSWLAPKERIAAGDFRWIRNEAAAAVTAVREIRKGETA